MLRLVQCRLMAAQTGFTRRLIEFADLLRLRKNWCPETGFEPELHRLESGTRLGIRYFVPLKTGAFPNGCEFYSMPARGTTEKKEVTTIT